MNPSTSPTTADHGIAWPRTRPGPMGNAHVLLKGYVDDVGLAGVLPLAPWLLGDGARAGRRDRRSTPGRRA